jgi:hypothetical protein
MFEFETALAAPFLRLGPASAVNIMSMNRDRYVVTLL